MNSDEYLRVRALCTVMANQSNLPNEQARWVAPAQASDSLARDPPVRGCVAEDNDRATRTLELALGSVALTNRPRQTRERRAPRGAKGDINKD
jgi:hypothetical protein